jgi:hypothetical protein
MRPVTRERRWTIVAIAIVVVGVGVGMLFRAGMIPLWASTLATVTMAIGAIAAAIAAARAHRSENQNNV